MKDLQNIIEDFIQKATNKKIKNFVKQNRNFIGVEPIRILDNHKRIFYDEFDLHNRNEARIQTHIGFVKIQHNHYLKLKVHRDKSRKNFIKYIRPTLVSPNEIREIDGEKLFLKLFVGKRLKLHVVILKEKKDGIFYVTNFPADRLKKWEAIKEKGNSTFELPQACK